MKTVTELERTLILQTLQTKYGYDFSSYAPASFDRRLSSILIGFQLADYAELLARLLRDPDFFSELLPRLTVGTTEMFRDPLFFKTLREEIFPHLETFASLNFWVAGCSTGQEAYSLAILLKEAGLYNRSVIFSTDVNPQALRAAKEGIFPAESVRAYTRNYQEAGGIESFSRYYTADYGFVRMAADLKDNMVFSDHNLVADKVFTEAHLILCRNVLIYFNKALQNRVLNLFADTLRFNGYLALGSKENLRFSSVARRFDTVESKHKIYRKQGSVTA